MDKKQTNKYLVPLWKTKSVYQLLKDRKTIIEMIIGELQQSLRDAPDGKLRVSMNKCKKDKETGISGCKYYLREKNEKTGRYIKKQERHLIPILAQKEYDTKILQTLEKENRLISFFLNHMKENEYEEILCKMNPAKARWLSQLTLTDKEYAEIWQNQTYEPMGFSLSEPIFLTKKGERVRSKSEIIIANMLYDYGIPYLYELPLKDGLEIWARPDFTVLNIRKRNYYFWEHNGKMDDPEYLAKVLAREEKYRKHGIFQGDNIIFTYESKNHPIDIETIKSTIEHFLL